MVKTSTTHPSMQMADYKAPLRDRRFVLNEAFEDAKLWTGLPALADSIDA
jgi:hypothetical protein